MIPSLEFQTVLPYLPSEGGITIPVLISFGGSSIDVAAKVDTGSQYCVFEELVARDLGIDLESGDRIRMSTATGLFTAYGHDVTMTFDRFQFESHVHFADVRRSVLGQTGWLDRLCIGIVHHDNLLYVASYNQ